MAAASSTRRNAILLVALLFAQLLLMSSSVRGGTGATLLESWTVGLTSPVVALASWVGGTVRGAWTGAGDLISAHGRNRDLEREVRELRAEVRQRREATLENARLRRLLGMRADLVPDSIGASIVTSNVTGGSDLIIVDRGTRHGVRPDLPVVVWGSVVGKVVAAYARRSKVRLVTDIDSEVAGVIQRSRAQGLTFGTGDEMLELRFVPRFSDVVLGDRVISSGLDGIFPRGFGIGRVTAVREDPGGTQTIEVEPDVNYRALEEVVILLESSGGGLETNGGLGANAP